MQNTLCFSPPKGRIDSRVPLGVLLWAREDSEQCSPTNLFFLLIFSAVSFQNLTEITTECYTSHGVQCVMHSWENTIHGRVFLYLLKAGLTALFHCVVLRGPTHIACEISEDKVLPTPASFQLFHSKSDVNKDEHFSLHVSCLVGIIHVRGFFYIQD